MFLKGQSSKPAASFGNFTHYSKKLKAGFSSSSSAGFISAKSLSCIELDRSSVVNGMLSKKEKNISRAIQRFYIARDEEFGVRIIVLPRIFV